MNQKMLPVLIAGLMLSGCSGFSNWNTYKSSDSQTTENLRAAIKDSRTSKYRESLVTVTDDDLPIAVQEVEADDSRDSVTLSANNAAFFGLIKGLAIKQGFSMAAMEGVDVNKRLSVQINGMSTIQAIRQIANLAGYVAVINQSDRSVTIAHTATYTFKIPPGLFKPLNAKYTVGGDPAASSSSSSGSSTGGSSSSGGSSAIKSSFVISSDQQAGSTSSGLNSQASTSGLKTYLQAVAGSGAQVDVYPESGLISVRSNGSGLKRIGDFLQTFCQDGMRQVEVTAAIVEVGVNDEFQYGIKWNKILNAAGTKTFTYDMTGVNTNIATPGSLNITTASITAVVQALEQFTRTRIVSQPSAVALNHKAATLFDGTQIPYLPSVTSSLSGTTGTTQSSGTGAYALDGVSISVIPDIMSNDLVQLTLVPVTAQVGAFSTFSLGTNSGSIQMPKQTVKQSTMQVMVQSDRTVILGGSRSAKAADTRTGLPWLGKLPIIGALAGAADIGNNVVESVVLVHARILPAPRYDALVAEAI